MRSFPVGLTLLSLPLLSLAACGGDDGVQAPLAASVRVTPDSISFEQIGESRQLEAIVLDVDGNRIEDVTVTWESTRTSVATVDQQGLVTSAGAGTAVITAVVPGGVRELVPVDVTLAAFSCDPGGGSALNLAVGQFHLIGRPAEFCLRFSNPVDQEYLIGVQSTSGNGALTTPVLLRTRATAATAAAQASPPAASGGGGAGGADLRALLAAGPGTSRQASLMASHRRSHARYLERATRHLQEMPRMLRPLASAPAAPRQPVARPGMLVGDTVTLRTRILAREGCGVNAYADVKSRLVVKGRTAWWFEDVENAEDGFTQEDWQNLADFFDEKIHAVDTDHFGEPTDLDENGVIAILFTKELNRQGSGGDLTLGFVNPCDFWGRDTFETSNEGEFFYHLSADPRGVHGDSLSVETILDQARFVIAHEYTHIIQFGRRLQRPNADLMSVFLMEGQATLSEEVVGHALLGNRTRQNYLADVVFSQNAFDWYANGLIDLFFYYGLDLENELRVDAAPEECTWISDDPPDPCASRPSWYGVTWSFLRWYSDQFDERFPGGAQEFQRRLIDNDRSGLENIRAVVHTDLNPLLGQWAAMLYLDDRLSGMDPLLYMPSWNLSSIYSDLNPQLVPLLRPEPRRRIFNNFEDAFRIRAPSFEWYLFSGTTSGPASIRVTNQTRDVLPAHMQVWVVRTR